MATQYMLTETTPLDGPGYTFFVCTSEKLTLEAVATKKKGYGMGHPLRLFVFHLASHVRTWTITNMSDNSKVGELTYNGSIATYDSSAVKLSLES